MVDGEQVVDKKVSPLQENNLDVVYRPGSGNVAADALSRAPVRAERAGQGDDERPAAGAQQAEERPATGGEGRLMNEPIRVEQAIEKFRKKGGCGALEIMVIDSLVCIRMEGGSSRVVLPMTLWANALRESPDSVYAGHLHKHTRGWQRLTSALTCVHTYEHGCSPIATVGQGRRKRR